MKHAIIRNLSFNLIDLKLFRFYSCFSITNLVLKNWLPNSCALIFLGTHLTKDLGGCTNRYFI
jgi:hypothetical protein